MAGDIKCALMYVNNPKNCEVTGNINAIDLAKETKPIDLVFNELPVTNRIKLNGVDFGYPNLADSSGRLVRDTDKDGVIDGWTLEMKDSSAKACIDSTDMCQTISIQGLHEFGANINRDYKVNQLDKIGLAAFIKVLGDVVAFVQINWFDSNNVYISNVNGKGSSSLSWDWITLDTTAPVGAVIARVRLVVVPKALGKSGKVYFRNVIIENKTSLL